MTDLSNTVPAPQTSVPFPVLGPNGYILPNESAILAGCLADLNAAFGGNLNIEDLSTPQGQVASSEAAIIGDSFALFALYVALCDPAYSSGRMQDAIGRLYFINRIAGEPTVQPCICAGLEELQLPIGMLALDPSNNQWISTQTGTIVNGQAQVNFSCTTNGPVAAPESLKIYQAPFGLDTITPTGDAVLGRNVETPAEFELRRSQSVGLNSMGPLNAIYGAVAEIPGVLDVYTAQNNQGTNQTVGGVVLLAHSIYVCVLGGVETDIAMAIFTRKMPGCNMTGNTVVTVEDPNPAYIAPVPTYQITYETPTVVPFAVVVTIQNSPQVPANALTLVQQAIVSAFAGGDGGPRAKIGSNVLSSRYVSTVSGISNTYNGATGQVTPGWSAAIISIQLGIDGAAASITGSISGSTLHVTAVAGGTIAVGDLVEGTGVAPNTIITGLSGGTGGTGNYMVSVNQAMSSSPLALTALGNSSQMNINQAPAVSAANVYLILD